MEHSFFLEKKYINKFLLPGLEGTDTPNPGTPLRPFQEDTIRSSAHNESSTQVSRPLAEAAATAASLAHPPQVCQNEDAGIAPELLLQLCIPDWWFINPAEIFWLLSIPVCIPGLSVAIWGVEVIGIRQWHEWLRASNTTAYSRCSSSSLRTWQASDADAMAAAVVDVVGGNIR